jgi:putative transposase
MTLILPKLHFFVKQRLLKNFRRCRDAATRTRYLIIIKLDAGRSAATIAEHLQIHRDTVYRVAARYRQRGEAGLLDGRAHNGPNKLNGDFLSTLDRLVRSSPQEHGHRRPTWTRELLLITLTKLGFPKVHVATLSRALAQIRARRARPRPTVGCPWSKRRKARRLREIRELIAGLPRDEAAVYEDEVDIHLNPKIGYDWTGYGQQKEVVTPGKNEKRYLAGALDVRTGELHYVEGEHKDSWLFVRLLGKLYLHYSQAKRIHVILDNYGIHDSKLVAWGLLQAQGRIKLHPLPPYCPNDNKIERTWQDLHAEVTRNHTCPDMRSLMVEVRHYLKRRCQQALGSSAVPKEPRTEAPENRAR